MWWNSISERRDTMKRMKYKVPSTFESKEFSWNWKICLAFCFCPKSLVFFDVVSRVQSRVVSCRGNVVLFRRMPFTLFSNREISGISFYCLLCIHFRNSVPKETDRHVCHAVYSMHASISASASQLETQLHLQCKTSWESVPFLFDTQSFIFTLVVGDSFLNVVPFSLHVDDVLFANSWLVTDLWCLKSNEFRRSSWLVTRTLFGIPMSRACLPVVCGQEIIYVLQEFFEKTAERRSSQRKRAMKDTRSIMRVYKDRRKKNESETEKVCSQEMRETHFCKTHSTRSLFHSSRPDFFLFVMSLLLVESLVRQSVNCASSSWVSLSRSHVMSCLSWGREGGKHGGRQTEEHSAIKTRITKEKPVTKKCHSFQAWQSLSERP